MRGCRPPIPSQSRLAPGRAAQLAVDWARHDRSAVTPRMGLFSSSAARTSRVDLPRNPYVHFALTVSLVPNPPGFPQVPHPCSLHHDRPPETLAHEQYHPVPVGHDKFAFHGVITHGLDAPLFHTHTLNET